MEKKGVQHSRRDPVLLYMKYTYAVPHPCPHLVLADGLHKHGHLSKPLHHHNHILHPPEMYSSAK